MRFNAERLRFYTKLSTFGSFGKGWVRRVADNLSHAANDNADGVGIVTKKLLIALTLAALGRTTTAPQIVPTPAPIALIGFPVPSRRSGVAQARRAARKSSVAKQRRAAKQRRKAKK